MQVAIVVAVAVATIVSTQRHETAGALPAPGVLGEAPFVRPDSTLVQTLTVERPAGQIALEVSPIDSTGHLGVTVTDTRAEDPGWSVTMTLADSAGRSREWTPASAPAGNGLGIAHLVVATLPAPVDQGATSVRVSLTVV